LYEVTEPFWQFVDHWQTLIAGGLAVVAGAGAIWGTIRSANREIAAAQEQTKAAQRQTAVTREIERRRIAREGYAFHAMLEAAMGAVIADVGAARELSRSDFSPVPGIVTYQVRQRVKRAGFAELRGAFLRFGGPNTAQFLQLDEEIEDFAGQWEMGLSGGVSTRFGLNAGELEKQLARIEQQALALRDHAASGMNLCRDELAKELVALEC
jgi:uncharacterized protein YfiM (DUF2279 family)